MKKETKDIIVHFENKNNEPTVRFQGSGSEIKAALAMLILSTAELLEERPIALAKDLTAAIAVVNDTMDSILDKKIMQ